MSRSAPRPERLIAALTLLAACGGTAPRALVEGEDACEVCRMAIADTRFGGEVVLSTGRHRTFDSIECLTEYLATAVDTAQVVATYVSDYDRRTLIDATSAVYMRGGSLRSPMGRELSAFAPGSDPAGLVAKYGGVVLDWAGVRQAAATARHTAHLPRTPAEGLASP